MVSTPAAAARLAGEHPASFVAFDVLAAGGVDVRSRPWRERRLLLETLADGFDPPLQVSPYTDDQATALEWFADYPAVGVEGLVAKGAGSPYRAGVRGWVKVKSRTSIDAIIGAVIGPLERPEALVVGRYTDDGELTIVGRTVPLSTGQATAVAAVIGKAVGAHPWPEWIGSGHFGGPIAISRVAPQVVVEVTADTALQAGRHRHALRLVRLRPDLTPDDVSSPPGGAGRQRFDPATGPD